MPSLPGAEAGAAPRIVPVTVITGYLGAGKTTMIRSLLGALPPGYTCAWLKNEYGDAAVDSAVAADARIAVKEVTNGCLCCTKVGELTDALTALHEMKPDRILVEASGSALPGPLVWEIQKLPQMLSVDGVVTVVDCLNFERISDFTTSARVQAQCTDLVLLNKCELAGEARVDTTLDDLHQLVPDVPKVRTVGEGASTDPALIFGLDAHLWRSSQMGVAPAGTALADHMSSDAETFHVLPAAVPDGWLASRALLEAMLKVAPPDDLYRSKGVVPLAPAEAAAELAKRAGTGAAQDLPGYFSPSFVATSRLESGGPELTAQGGGGGGGGGEGGGGGGGGGGDVPVWWLFNGVAGRLTLEPLTSHAGPASLVFMGRDLFRRKKAIAAALGLPPTAVVGAAMASGGGPLVPRGVARGLCVPCE